MTTDTLTPEQKLRVRFDEWEYGKEWHEALDGALAAERRATVERLKQQVLDGAFIPSGIHDQYLDGITAARQHYLDLLDAEAAR